jgi:hypothetical protein
MLEEAGVAHENDLEGCLIVVEKDGNDLKKARVVFVETLHHNNFSLYVPDETPPKGFGLLRLEDGHPLLYVEPKGHGVKAYSGDERQTARKEFLIYKFRGKAEDPEQENDGAVGYDLLPIETTLWARARSGAGANLAYGSSHNYGQIVINVVGSNGSVVSRKIMVGKVGSAFFGDTGGRNMARPPWAWFNNSARQQPLGLWFFDPATIVKRDFRLGESFRTAYVRVPFWARSR